MASKYANEEDALLHHVPAPGEPVYYSTWITARSFAEAVDGVLGYTRIEALCGDRGKFWERLIAHWRSVLVDCEWRREFYEDLVAFDDCRDIVHADGWARYSNESINKLLMVAVCLGRCDLVHALAPQFQPLHQPAHVRILLAIKDIALLPVVDLLLNLQPLEQKRAEDVIEHLATTTFLPVSFFALRCAYSDYMLVKYAPPEVLPMLESYGVCMESERHLVEMLSDRVVRYPRARYHVSAMVEPSETVIALAKRSTAYFVLFDTAARARLRTETQEGIEAAWHEGEWTDTLHAADLRALEESRTADYCVLDHLTERVLTRAAARRW